MQLYHCHATPLKKHIHKGLYGAFIIDPPEPRRPARELVMVMNGFDTDGDGENNFYTVNGKAFYYAKYPIRVKRSETLRIYLANLTEFDLINSFHLHGEFFRYYRTGSTDQFEYTDTVMQCQGERGIIEIDWHHAGRFMFHAHQSEFAELGWMGFFEVEDDVSTEPVGAARGGPWGVRLLALVPIVLLVAIAAAFVASGNSITGLVGSNPPPPDTLEMRRVEFHAGRDQPAGAQPPARGHHDRRGHGGRRGRAVHRGRAQHPRAPALGDHRDPLPLGRGRPVPVRRHQLDAASSPRSPWTRPSTRPSAERRGVRRLRPDRPPGGGRPGRPRDALAALPAPGRPALAGRLHGPHRRAADVPGGRRARRGPRAPGEPCPARWAGPGWCSPASP